MEGGAEVTVDPTRAVFEVVSPVPPSTYRAGVTGEQLLDLNGKTICELWDDLFRGPEIFAVLREELRRRFPSISFVGHEAFGNIHDLGPTEMDGYLVDLLRVRRCDGVIAGVGC